MYSIRDFKRDLDVCHMEITFDMPDGHYFFSDSLGDGVLIYGPQNDERVQTSDDALDKLLVMGKPMREMMQAIDPD